MSRIVKDLLNELNEFIIKWKIFFQKLDKTLKPKCGSVPLLLSKYDEITDELKAFIGIYICRNKTRRNWFENECGIIFLQNAQSRQLLLQFESKGSKKESFIDLNNIPKTIFSLDTPWRDLIQGKDKNYCMICLEPVQSRGYINVCDHLFCCECILKWSTINNCCPACKRIFTEIRTYETSPQSSKSNSPSTSPTSSPTNNNVNNNNSDNNSDNNNNITSTISSITIPTSSSSTISSISSKNTTNSNKSSSIVSIDSTMVDSIATLQSTPSTSTTTSMISLSNSKNHSNSKKRKYEKIYSISPNSLGLQTPSSENSTSTDVWFDFVNNNDILAAFISRLHGESTTIVDLAEYRSLFYHSIISGLGLHIPNVHESIESDHIQENNHIEQQQQQVNELDQLNQAEIINVNTIEDCKENYV